jgi:hypothetical protein
LKIRPFARIRSATPVLELIQDSLVKFFRQIEVNSQLDGRDLDFSITGGTNAVLSHGLGREPEGWTLCDLNANTVVYRVSWTSTSITITAASSCAGKIRVY